MSLSETKSQVHQFLATRYPAYFEEYPAAALEEVASNEVLASDVEGEVDWYLADLTEIDLSSRTSICGDY